MLAGKINLKATSPILSEMVNGPVHFGNNLAVPGLRLEICTVDSKTLCPTAKESVLLT